MCVEVHLACLPLSFAIKKKHDSVHLLSQTKHKSLRKNDFLSHVDF